MHLAHEQKCKRVKMILHVDHNLGDCIVVLSPFTTKKRSVNDAREHLHLHRTLNTSWWKCWYRSQLNACSVFSTTKLTTLIEKIQYGGKSLICGFDLLVDATIHWARHSGETRGRESIFSIIGSILSVRSLGKHEESFVRRPLLAD